MPNARRARDLILTSVALLPLLAAPHAAAAQEPAARIGAVDLAVVRLLHPLNLLRDPETGLRARPLVARAADEVGAARDARDAEHARAVAECEAETLRIRDRQSLLRRIIREIEAEVEEARRDLKGRYALEYAKPHTEERAAALETIRRDLRRIDEQIGYRAATVENEIRSGEARVRALRERAFAVHFLAAAEAAECEARIARETLEAVRKVAAAKRLHAVINRAALVRASERPAPPDPAETHWRTGAGGFPMLLHAARDEIDFAPGGPPPDAAALADYGFRLRELLARSLSDAPPPVAELVPYGGADVTVAVVEELLRRHGYRRERIEAAAAAVVAHLSRSEAR